MTDYRVITFLPQQHLKNTAGARHGPGISCSDLAQHMDLDVECLQLLAQPAGKAQSKLRFHCRTQMTEPGQRDQISLHASEKIAAANVEHTHQATLPRICR